MAIKKRPQITIKKNVKDETGYHTDVVVKDGVPIEHSEKHFTSPCMGMNKGVTVNMGDFQSLRVDVWLSLPLSDNPTRKEISQTHAQLADYIDRILDEEIDKETNN